MASFIISMFLRGSIGEEWNSVCLVLACASPESPWWSLTVTLKSSLSKLSAKLSGSLTTIHILRKCCSAESMAEWCVLHALSHKWFSALIQAHCLNEGTVLICIFSSEMKLSSPINKFCEVTEVFLMRITLHMVLYSPYWELDTLSHINIMYSWYHPGIL